MGYDQVKDKIGHVFQHADTGPSGNSQKTDLTLSNSVSEAPGPVAMPKNSQPQPSSDGVSQMPKKLNIRPKQYIDGIKS